MTYLERSFRHIGVAGLAGATLFLAGCLSDKPLPPPTPPPTTMDTNVNQFPLQIGDTVEVDLTGTRDTILPTITPLNGAGTISLPSLETNILAVGKTPHELETTIHDLYVPNVYPHISVTVTPGPRFFYVGGQINMTGTGKQLYTGKVTVLGAISAAGGFNDFAAKTKVQVTRQNGTISIVNCKKALKHPELDLEIFPGDKIEVPKQSFLDALFGR